MKKNICLKFERSVRLSSQDWLARVHEWTRRYCCCSAILNLHAMWTEQKNQTDFTLHGTNTTSQGVLEPPPWMSSTAEQTAGTTVVPWQSHTEQPLEPGSGIIPGMTASALFICFVLAVYALLWKCMVSPPRRRNQKRRNRPLVRDPRPLPC
ncbi:uncharacterized protein sb:cb288 isoform X2 [Engraulis encrasicolus]|uniref:uncharacterized protein sb:cb288 isoform X2 n=1 Tax=Engraulis encrasicolus TaxID=184585 RepID=UPI002FD75293